MGLSGRSGELAIGKIIELSLSTYEPAYDELLELFQKGIKVTIGFGETDFCNTKFTGRPVLEDSDNETNNVVGYARKQSKSTAFWGSRKTPISGKIKKKILKERRQKKQTKKSNNLDQDAESEREEENCKKMVDVASEQVVYANENKPCQQQGEQRDLSNSAIPVAASYQETVQSVKREQKSRRRQRQKSKDTRRESNDEEVLLNRQEDEDSSSTTRHSRNNHDGGNEANNGELDFTSLQKVAELEEESSTSSSSFGGELPHESFVGGVFAALAVHDSENDSDDE